MEMKAGQCLHNFNGICSHGKYQNFPCVGKCSYFCKVTKEMAEQWNTKGYIATNDGPNLVEEDEMQRKSFSYKKVHSVSLDSLAMKVDQDELYEFDNFLREQVEFGLLSQEKYESLYQKAYDHSYGRI